MYKRILVAVEHSDADRTIIEHVKPLAKMCGATLVLLHVADGWAARAYDELKLRESKEIHEDRAYLDELRREPRRGGLRRGVAPRDGRPGRRRSSARPTPSASTSWRWPRTATSSSKDILLGATVDKVRHELKVPVLLLQAR